MLRLASWLSASRSGCSARLLTGPPIRTRWACKMRRPKVRGSVRVDLLFSGDLGSGCWDEEELGIPLRIRSQVLKQAKRWSWTLAVAVMWLISQCSVPPQPVIRLRGWEGHQNNRSSIRASGNEADGSLFLEAKRDCSSPVIGSLVKPGGDRAVEVRLGLSGSSPPAEGDV
jgi:hypothetical protein